MSTKVEVGKDNKQEIVGEFCFTLKASLDVAQLPVNILDDAWKIVSIIAYSLDTKYHKRVFVCVRGSEVEIAISNEYVNHIDTCMSACLDAFEAAKCKKEGAAAVCYAHCRKLVRRDAYNSLYATYIEATKELEKMGYKYAAKFDEEEDAPQSLKVTVWF